ncbi:MAG: response regulator transcription factor [Methylococcales bacterium]
MKLLIADDEPLARERLKFLVNDIDNFIEIAEAANGIEVLNITADFDPDIILMDIKMPGMDGLEAAQQLSQLNNPPAIIFTTAYEQYVLAAFDTQAVAYLLKPIRKKDLKKKLDACYRLNKTQSQTAFPKLASRTHISITSKGKTSRIDIENICYFSADQKYIQVIYIINNQIKKSLIDETLKHLEKDFRNIFIRVHHKTLVKISLLDTLTHQSGGKYLLKLKNIDSSIEVSRRHAGEVKNLLKS